MALFHRYRKAMLYVHRTATISPIQKLCFIAHCNSSYSTSTSDQPSFTVNYLITNLQFSQEIASHVSKHVRLQKPERSDSVIALFRNYGFSNSQIAGIIKDQPLLLVADAHKTILPKLQFLESKGASRSEVVHIATSWPRFLRRSLENCVIPSYDSLKTFLLSDEQTIEYIKHRAYLITENRIAGNVTLLLDNGVPESKVALLFKRPLSIKSHPDFFKKVVEEVKELGFNPSKADFVIALRVKIVVSESAWRKKIDLYKRWGWSEDTTASAFLRRPWCMSISEGKIEEIMEFFITHLGWDSMELAKHPRLLSFSLQKRIMPRASVIQFLQSKELISKNYRHVRAFVMSEKLFRNNFVNCFKEKAPELLKLYEEKQNISNRWGWSEDTTASAFLRRPWCMSISEGKIDEIMEFFVTHLGWDSMEVAKHPKLLSFNLQKRIMPRASVIQFLQSKELISKNYRHVRAFLISEKSFRNNFVNCFKEKAPELLKLYEEKQNIANK